MSLTRRLAVVGAAAAVLLGGLSAPSAQADGCTTGGWLGGGNIGAGAGNCPEPTDGDPTDGPSTGPEGGTTETRPANPCHLEQWMTGPEMAEYAGQLGSTPIEGWELHKDDQVGAWYQPECVWHDGDGALDEFWRFSKAFKKDNPPGWYVFPPPEVPIPTEYLGGYAKRTTGIPLANVAVNPTGETVVGLRTWVWPSGGPPKPVSVTARSGPVNWATVTATPGKLQLRATDADVGSCDRAPAYTTGAPDSATDCYVEFRSSSARSGKSTIHVTIQWHIVLTTSDGPPQVLAEAFPRSNDVEVGVAEVQSVLR